MVGAKSPLTFYFPTKGSLRCGPSIESVVVTVRKWFRARWGPRKSGHLQRHTGLGSFRQEDILHIDVLVSSETTEHQRSRKSYNSCRTRNRRCLESSLAPPTLTNQGQPGEEGGYSHGQRTTYPCPCVRFVSQELSSVILTRNWVTLFNVVYLNNKGK